MQKQASALKTPARPASTGHKRGWVGNSPTPAQLKAFFDQIPTEENPTGINTSERLQVYLRNAPFAKPGIIVSPVSKAPENKAAKLAEELAFKYFPNRAREIMDIMEPLLVLDFRLEIKPLGSDQGGRINPVAELKGLTRNSFSFWIHLDDVNVHKIREGSPCNLPERPDWHPKSADIHYLVTEMYAEQRKAQANLNASLEKNVNNICETTAQNFADAFFQNDMLRYGLISKGCIGRIIAVLRELLKTAVTMAAVGDTERMQITKAALDFQLKGNPLVDVVKKELDRGYIYDATVIHSPALAFS